jgi:hypothetical protein
MQDNELEKYLDKQLVLEGFALNAKAGAVVMTDSNTVVYVTDLQEWPEDFVNDRVEIKGVLHRGRVYPDVEVENGVSSQGLPGDQYYIDLEGYRKA